ncbi:MAG TPA: MopE-related protein [Acidimicrobiales bacterium]|nr:MopE-related protein [Acidimicrobiales bacterium]
MRKSLAVGAVMAIGFVSSVVVAEWLATGTGSGSVRAVEAQELTTQDVVLDGSLYPGGTADLTVRIDNPNPFPVTVTSVTQAGAITSGIPECDANNAVTLDPKNPVSLAVSAGSAQTFTLAGWVAMGADAANECQGALFTIPLSLNGGSGADDGGGGGGDDVPLDCDDGDPDTFDFEQDGQCFNLEEGAACPGGTISAGVCVQSDLDGDGFTVEAGDCDDTDPTVNPDAAEVVGNDVDENCDGSLET